MAESDGNIAVAGLLLAAVTLADNTVLVTGTFHVVAIVVVEVDQLGTIRIGEANRDVNTLEAEGGVEAAGELGIRVAEDLAVCVSDALVAIGVFINDGAGREELKTIVRNCGTHERVSFGELIAVGKEYLPVLEDILVVLCRHDSEGLEGLEGTDGITHLGYMRR